MSEPNILKCRECGEHGPELYRSIDGPCESDRGWCVWCENCERSTGHCKSRLVAVRAHNKQVREEEA